MGAFQEYARAAIAAGKKRGRHPVMNAQQFYPRGLERELEQKTAAEFLRIYRGFLEAAVAGFSTFGDDQLDLAGKGPELSEKFKGEVMDVARRTDRKARDNFSRQSEMIIGAPYYPPGTAEGILDDWHATFQDLCVSACAQQKTRMAVIVAGAKQAGWNKAQLEKAIEGELPARFRHRAELIARTELGKLNSRVTIETYKSAGVRYYKWLTTIDGRERDSHAAMNGRICSVSDGDVYFEQNPERPLRPVELQRTGDMYHGHPGTDFQCRCSMVMWDPEIDGDYEVKDSDVAEERKEAERAEREAREAAEAERQAKEQAERERAAEALEKAREEARRAEAERIAAERARMEAEETARRLAEEARRARLEAAAAKRHAARTPEAEKATLSAWNKRRIGRIAEARHAGRTEERAAEIRKEWDGRRAKIREAVKNVGEIRKEYSGIKGLPFPSTVRKAENGAKYTKAAELARKFKAKAEAEAARLDLLENPLEAMRKHGIEAAREAQEAVRKKLESFAGLDIDTRIKKLEFEMDWVEKQKKYATWEVARDAYGKALAAAKFGKAVSDASARIQALEAAAKAAKDGTLTGYVNRLKKAGTPTTRAELDALEREIEKAEKRAAKVKPPYDTAVGSTGLEIFSDSNFTEKRKNAALYGKDSSEKWKIDATMRPDVESLWEKASLKEKRSATAYTEGSGGFNRPLRGYDGSWSNFKGIGKVPLNQEGREDAINALTNLIDKAKIKQDVWLSRGWESSDGAAGFLNISTKEFNKLSSLSQKKLETKFVGKVFFDPAFMSCGTVKGSGFHGSLVGNIYAPKGSRAIYAEPFSHYNGDSMSEKRPWNGKSKYSYGTEFETIIQRGTSYRCTKAYFDNGQLYMDFEIVSQNKF